MQKLSREELKQEQESIKNHFKMNKINVDSLLFRVILDESISSIDATPASVFDGEGVIYENLFDLKFRISPDAFFQVRQQFIVYCAAFTRSLLSGEQLMGFGRMCKF